jgi:hypothetical protein
MELPRTTVDLDAIRRLYTKAKREKLS